MSTFKGGEPTTDKSAAQLVAEGYRVVSRAHGLVARIDRPDWMIVLAKKMPGRVVADFCIPPGNPDWGSALPPEQQVGCRAGDPSGQWCDHYRRMYSKDTHTVDPDRLKLIPTSGHDPVAYVDRDNLTPQPA